ncbi:MAG: hypothetical protein IJV93_09215 [Lentisphaeria bacterium]|nr:hypothetical protein [Lentisphaeria bacterium]
MPYFIGVPLLLLLESTFVFTVLALLFHQRTNIGKSPFTMAFSALLLLTFLTMGADIQAHLWSGLFFSVPKVIMFTPLMAIYLLTYIVDGTLSAQRLIYGILAVGVVLVYIAEMIYLQCSWSTFSISAGVSGPALEMLLNGAKKSLFSAVIPVVFSVFSIPIIYSSLTELRFGRLCAVVVSMLSAQVLIIVPNWLLQLGAGITPEWFTGDCLAQLIINLWLGVLLGSYLKLTEKEEDAPSPRRPLDLFFAFFGSYGRSKELEQNLTAWQNRYRLLLHNASEIIIIFDGSNCVKEANLAARRVFGNASKPGTEGLLRSFSNIKPAEFSFDSPVNETAAFRCSCFVEGKSEELKLYCSWNIMKLQDEEYRMLIARDITQEIKLTEEKRALREQLVHSQRLESLGVLAGGVAHDFNNYIHAILGHVDLARLIGSREKNWTQKIDDHLCKIITIAEKAGELTKQLLGFARRGNYVETDFDPALLFQSTFDLIGPKKLSGVEIETDVPAKRFLIHCDQLQLQQVVVNIIINALYAMEKNESGKKLNVSLVPAAELPDSAFAVPPGIKVRSTAKKDYCCIAVADNGSGMDQETVSKIFEPFFTTKPQGEGSGMGLSMAYGIVTNCGGWISVESTPGEGSTFRLFLPDVTQK